MLDEEWQEKVSSLLHQLQEKFPGMDYLFWEGVFSEKRLQNHSQSRDLLLVDLALFEMRFFEKILQAGTGFIYYVPCKSEVEAKAHASFFSLLCDEANKKTIIAFSAVAGAKENDHLGPHPFWEVLRSSPDVSSTPLLPILNIGAIKQGEGFWPILTTDLMEKFLCRLNRHHFAGALLLVKHIPEEGSFLDCNLFTAGAFLWGESSAELLAESWFLAFREDISYLKNSEVFGEIRQLNRCLSSLRSISVKENKTYDELRVMSESLISQINRLQYVASKNCVSNINGKPTFNDYFTYFARDARKMILHYLQMHNLPMVNVLNGDDLLDSFWTGIGKEGNFGNKGGVKVVLFENPKEGESGSMMRKIYREVDPGMNLALERNKTS